MRILCVLLAATLLAANGYAASPPSVAVNAGQLATLRGALKSGQVAMKVKGDGQTTSKLDIGLTNKTAHVLRVVVPANEILLSHSLSIQNMMVTKDRIMTVPPGQTVWQTLDAACVSAKSVAPPPGQELEFAAGDYPDAGIWKQLASIFVAARELNASGAFNSTKLAAERRVNTIAQLAVWALLGKNSADPKDKVTNDVIGNDLLSAVGKKRDDLSKEQRATFDRGVDELFQCVDLTLRKSTEPDVQQIATLPNNSRGITFSQVADRAIDSGDFTEAEELLTASLDEASAQPSKPEYGNCLQKLGDCYLSEGKPQDAADYFKRAVETRSKYLGPEYAETAASIFGYAQALKGSGNAKEAIPLFEKALAIREKSLGVDGTITAESCCGLALAYLGDDRNEEAEKLLRRALLIRYKNLGPESTGVAEVNKNLGDVYCKELKWAQAEKSYKKSLEIAQKNLGKDHPYVAIVADGLAAAYRGQERDADADELSKSAAGIRAKALGGNETLIAAVPQDSRSIERLAMFSSNSDRADEGAKSLTMDRSISTPKADPNRPVKDKWALVIGISKFQDPSVTLKFAAKDAQDFAKYLVDEGKFAPDHVHVLTDEKATRANILSELGDRWLPHSALPDDLVVIYVSSHGSPSKADVRGTNYLICYDTDKTQLYATGIDMTAFTKMVKDRVKSDRVVMVLDACHSGAVNPTKGMFRQANFDAESVLQGTGQLVICSSEPSQTSWESSKYPNGVFTHYLLEGLRKQGDKTPLGTAFQYMKDKVQEEVLHDRGELQTPVLKSKWAGNDIVLSAPPAAPRSGQ